MFNFIKNLWKKAVNFVKEITKSVVNFFVRIYRKVQSWFRPAVISDNHKGGEAVVTTA